MSKTNVFPSTPSSECANTWQNVPLLSFSRSYPVFEVITKTLIAGVTLQQHLQPSFRQQCRELVWPLTYLRQCWHWTSWPPVTRTWSGAWTGAKTGRTNWKRRSSMWIQSGKTGRSATADYERCKIGFYFRNADWTLICIWMRSGESGSLSLIYALPYLDVVRYVDGKGLFFPLWWTWSIVSCNLSLFVQWCNTPQTNHLFLPQLWYKCKFMLKNKIRQFSMTLYRK